LDPFESFEVNEVLLIRPVLNAYLEGMCVGLFGGAVAQHLNEAFLVVQVPEVRVVDGNLAILEKFVHPWKKKERAANAWVFSGKPGMATTVAVLAFAT
jgi:hypothetical protein